MESGIDWKRPNQRGQSMLRQNCAREDACLNDQKLFALQPNSRHSQLWLKVKIVESVFDCSAEVTWNVARKYTSEGTDRPTARAYWS